MSHDAGNLEQRVSGGGLTKIFLLALLLLFTPFIIKSCKALPGDGRVFSGAGGEMAIGSRFQRERKSIPLTENWSPLIRIAPGNYFSVNPLPGSYVEFLPENGNGVIRLSHGKEFNVGWCSAFRLRGPPAGGGSAAIIYTEPVP